MCNPPRVKFCWECGNKLWGNRHVHMDIDGGDKILHKQCAEARKRPERTKFCPTCGATIDEDGCLFCGGALDESW